jgi:hypothetical protein
MSTPDHLNEIGKFISQNLSNPKLDNQKTKTESLQQITASTDRSKQLYPKFGNSVPIKLQKYRDTIETGIDSSSKTFTRDGVLNSNGRRKTTGLTLRGLLRGHDGAPGPPL